MRLTQQAFAAVGVALALSSAAAGGGWSNARTIATPATRSQSPGGIASVSCAPGGVCVAFGTYEVSGKPFGADVAYVATKSANGTWSKIKPIPGLAALVPGKPPRATAGQIACPSAGNCSAYGSYLTTFRGAPSAFVVTEKNGVWGRAKAVPALKSMHATTPPQFGTLACQSAGNCVAGGFYQIGARIQQAFVLSEVRGVWGRIQNPRGLRLGSGNRSQIVSAACPHAGACLALGSQSTSLVKTTLFAVTASKGAWGKVKVTPGDAPGTAACASTACVIAARFSQNGPVGDDIGTFTEKNGALGKVQRITLPDGYQIFPMFLACPQVDRCSLAYTVLPPSDANRPGYLATETHGTWGSPVLMSVADRPGAIDVIIRGIACGGPGDCSITGDVTDQNGLSDQAFLVDQSNGTWQQGFIVPGVTALDHDADSFGESVSCWASFHCVAGGVYDLSVQVTAHAFVSTQS